MFFIFSAPHSLYLKYNVLAFVQGFFYKTLYGAVSVAVFFHMLQQFAVLEHAVKFFVGFEEIVFALYFSLSGFSCGGGYRIFKIVQLFENLF